MKFQTIGINEVEYYLNRQNTIMIDLRTKEEYDLYHLEGAINIPYDDLGKNKTRLLRDKTYILYCERGGSSLMAAKELSQEGYRILSVIGGIRAWEEGQLN